MLIKIPFLSWTAKAAIKIDAPNLRAATEISVADLYGANLSRANLSGADLSRANLYGADLSRANLSGADLSRADLYGANLSRANLSGADLSRANLSGADLSRANLSGADLSGADLSGADLYGAKWNDKITLLTPPVIIYIPGYWTIFVLDSHLQIGCEIHTFDEWEGFDDRQILQMDSRRALEFRQIYKPALMAICKTRGLRSGEGTSRKGE